MQTSFSLTSRHTDILLLLYRFRFLTRAQIQSILNHKHHHRVIQWLHDLIEHKYVQLHTNLPTPTYSLGINGRRYLKDKEGVDISVLNKVWRDTQYSHNFQKRCLTVADIFLDLCKSGDENGDMLDFLTKAQLNGSEGLIKPAPDAYIVIEKTGGKIDRYFLEVFESVPPRIIRQRIQQYMDYYDSDEWQVSTNKEFPRVVVILSSEHLVRQAELVIKGHAKLSFNVCFSASKHPLVFVK